MSHSSPSARLITERAERKLEQREYAAALADYTFALRLDPTYGPAYLGLARARESIGDFNEAERVYAIAIQLSDAAELALVRRADLRQRLGRPLEATEDLERAVALRPVDRELVRKLARHYAERRAWTSALSIWRRFLQHQPQDPEARLQVRALSVLANFTDPVWLGSEDPAWVRRALARLASR